MPDRHDPSQPPRMAHRVESERDRPPTPASASAAPRGSRPIVERIGLAAMALVLAALFGGVAVAAAAGGEPFLAVMGGLGCLMILWVGTLTLLRG